MATVIIDGGMAGDMVLNENEVKDHVQEKGILDGGKLATRSNSKIRANNREISAQFHLIGFSFRTLFFKKYKFLTFFGIN